MRCRVLDCLLESFEIDVEKLVNFLLRAGVEDASMILRLGWLDQGLKKKLFEIDGAVTVDVDLSDGTPATA